MPRNPLEGKRILLGVTGSIACYKSADLASKLTQAGAEVDTVLTDAATQFVSPLTFQSVTGRRAYTDTDLWGNDAHVLHIGLAHAADLILIAPATAHTMAKLAHGLAGDLLSVTVLAADCPIIIAPAMDAGMWSHAATQANVEILEKRGISFIGPEEGRLASGLVARGRMSEPVDLFGQVRYALTRDGQLQGRRFVVTAGGTRERLDPVRFLSNHSSGKQGYALAQAALDAGAEVTLVTSARLRCPAGANCIEVDSALEMYDRVLSEVSDADALIMAAAVADFRPAETWEHKIKKTERVPFIELKRNPDILMEVAKRRSTTGNPRIVVGFAAETDDLLENAKAKLEKKGLSLIVANDVSAADAGFAVDTNRVTLLADDGSQESLPLMGKDEVAARIVDWTAGRLRTT